MRLSSWIAALLLTLPAHAGAAPVQVADSSREQARDGDRRRWESILAACEATGVESTAQQLEGEGSQVIVWLVRLRLGLESTRVQLTECAREATLRALRSRRSQARDELVAQLFSAPATPAHAESAALPFAAAMLALAELGDERDLALLVDWAVEFERQLEGAGGPAAAKALRASIGALAASGAKDRTAWRRALERLPESLRTGAVRGLADCGGDDALTRLAEWLEDGPVSRHLLLAEIARAARREDRRFREEILQTVRALLRDSDEDLVRDSALCAGALGDEASVDTLITTLSHRHPGVRASSLWSLTRLTGRKLGPVAQPWARWIDAEQRWWRDEAAELLRALEGPDGTARVAAAQALAAHRFPRHTLAVELAKSLPLNDRGAAAIVNAALRQLGSSSAIEVLERRLSEANDPVVSEALRETIEGLRRRARPSPTTAASH